MKSLYLRIYATVVVMLLLFAAVSGWLFQRQIEHERGRVDSVLQERMEAWADLIDRSLPGPEAPAQTQAAALEDWSQRLHVPLALDDRSGRRIGASESFVRREQQGMRARSMELDDGRTLWVIRRGARAGSAARPEHGGRSRPPLPFIPFAAQRGIGLVVLLVILFVAVAAGAYPVVRRLTRRLEALKSGVEQFGAGALHRRVAIEGHDEVAAVANSFNVAAARIEALLQSHRSLLANASHELRSPLARMKMAVSMLDDAVPPQRERLRREIDTNVAELDALVEEVLLASRLDANTELPPPERIDLLALAVEEGARVDATVEGQSAPVVGEERLLRRALRNLLENARRYGGERVDVSVGTSPDGKIAVVRVCDRGPGVPSAMHERIFEPFFRLPGHAEQAGGVGLGLSLVKQIVERHGGRVRCDARAGGGSCFVVELAVASH